MSGPEATKKKSPESTSLHVETDQVRSGRGEPSSRGPERIHRSHHEERRWWSSLVTSVDFRSVAEGSETLKGMPHTEEWRVMPRLAGGRTGGRIADCQHWRRRRH